jgi:hypothetical protein
MATHRLAGPYDCEVCGQTHIRGCRGHKDRAKTVPCRNWPRRGTDVCPVHGGNAPQVKAKAAVRAEVMSWGLGDTTVDPGEVLLRLVTQSAARCGLYASRLEEAYDAAGRLAQVTRVDITVTGEGSDAERARQDLDRIFNHGPVAALIGHTYAATKDGDIYATGEKIRGLVELEATERDRCATFAAKAVAAGLAERAVRLAEQQGTLMATLFRGALDDAGLDDAARDRVEAAFMRRLTVVAEVKALSGGNP